ncbi:hypothetical protein Csa_023691, partial [Cucumis sativus]
EHGHQRGITCDNASNAQVITELFVITRVSSMEENTWPLVENTFKICTKSSLQFNVASNSCIPAED